MDNVQTAQCVASGVRAPLTDTGGNVVRMRSGPRRKTLQVVQRAERLLKARQNAGFKTGTEAARHMNVHTVTYLHHESAVRGFTAATAQIYARYLNVSAAYLIFGHASSELPQVAVVGSISGQGVVLGRMNSAPGLPATVPAPPIGHETLQALLVQTTELWPAYRPGDVVFYARCDRMDREAVTGQECVVESLLGEWMLRVCRPTGPETWTLESYTAPPITKARLRSASRVLWVQRALLPVHAAA